MKVTVTIPDELYRSVKVKSAQMGRTVRDVTVDLFRRWIVEDEASAVGEAPPADWVAEWLKHRIPAGQPGPTAREILDAGRGRHEARDATERPKNPPVDRPSPTRTKPAVKDFPRGAPRTTGKPRSRGRKRADR